MTDWVAWHRAYEDPSSSLSARLRIDTSKVHVAGFSRLTHPVTKPGDLTHAEQFAFR